MNTINLILHAHQPYVRHLEYEKFLEEDWLYESLNETYIPLLRMLNTLDSDGVNFKLSICFSPTLTTMLTDIPLQERFVSYMERHIELGEKEVERTKSEDRECHEMAKHYLEETKKNLEVYESFERNILLGFKKLSLLGKIELVSSAATHTYLPLYKDYPALVNAEVSVGIKNHQSLFSSPNGFWIPEGGYYPGLDSYLLSNGIEWVELPPQSAISSPDKSLFGGYRPIRLPSGLYGFVSNWSVTSLIWSNKTGYPCDADYREFYRDIGYYLPMDYIENYIHDPQLRVFTGYKYYAITGKTDDKRFYSLDKAMEKVKLHVDNFLYNIKKKGSLLDACGIDDHIFNLTFDAELFGHRWYEGIAFLEEFLRRIDKEGSEYQLSTPSNIISEGGRVDNIRVNEGSFGSRGGADVWLDSSNSWIYRHTIKAIERMQELVERFPSQGSLKERFLNQALRELLLALSSDWPSIIHDNTSISYAKKRVMDHLSSFNVVHSSMCRNTVNTEWLINAEKRSAIFPDIDYHVFSK